jgi:hypothetical protein
MLAFAALTLAPELQARASHAAPSGTEGQLALTRQPCLPTDDPVVTEVCGKFHLDWRFSLQDGEPVELYQLRWTLEAVKVETAPRPAPGDTPDPGRPAGQYWKIADLPEAVARGTERIELVLRGLAMLQGASIGKRGIWLAVDSGVAARPHGKPSYNVPHTPAWDEWLMSARQEAPLRAAVCQRQQSAYLHGGDARNIYRGGMQLVSYTQCPQELASAREVGRALRRHCQSAPAPAAAGQPDLCSAFQRLTVAREGVFTGRTHAAHPGAIHRASDRR